MRIASFIAASLISLSSVFAGEIREFSVATLERLGNEISHRDAIAARASDAVLETQPVARSLKMRGWITDLRKDGDMVYFITETPSGPRVAYIVAFRGSEKPQVEDHRGDPLPPNIAVRYNALQTAMKAVLPRLNTAYNPHYNFEVLNDPDGSGFLVYALATTTKRDEQLIGGHVRTTVSADGSKVERIDDLSRGIIRQAPEPGKQLAGMGTAQVIDTKYPVETFLYSSYLYRIPIGVATRDGKIWMVVNGKIEDTGEKADKGKAKSEQKKK